MPEIAKFMPYLQALLILIVGLIAIKIILFIARKALKKSKINVMLHAFVITVIKVALLVIVLIMILQKIGVDIAALVTILGVAGVTIAMALKDSLGNVAGGVMILCTKPFDQGDTVDVGGTVGNIEKIDLFLTTLKTFDNKVITIPNGTLSASIITNYTREDAQKVSCNFIAKSTSNLDNIKEKTLEIVKKSPIILAQPEGYVDITKVDDSSFRLDLHVWCKEDNMSSTKVLIEEGIKEILDN